MSRRPFLAAIALVGLAFSGVGCAGGAEPTVTVTRAAVADHTDEGARIEVRLRVDNLTEAALPVRAVVYRISVANAGTFEMMDHPPISLPPKSEQTVVLPAAFRDGEAAWVGRSVRVTGELRYQPPGQIRELLTEYRIPLPTAAFSATGELRGPDEMASAGE